MTAYNDAQEEFGASRTLFLEDTDRIFKDVLSDNPEAKVSRLCKNILAVLEKNSPPPRGSGDAMFGIEGGSIDVVVRVIAVVGDQVGSIKLKEKIGRVGTLIQ